MSELPTPRITAGFEITTQTAIVIDLAIVDEHELATCGHHGLMARRRQIDDRQPPVAERDPGFPIHPCTTVIRTAMPECLGHGNHGLSEGVGRYGAIWCQVAANTAH